MGIVRIDLSRHRAEQHYHKHDSRSICYFPRNKNPFFVHCASILIQALGFYDLDETDTLKYGGMSAMPPVPTSIFSYSFTKTFHTMKLRCDDSYITPNYGYVIAYLPLTGT